MADFRETRAANFTGDEEFLHCEELVGKAFVILSYESGVRPSDMKPWGFIKTYAQDLPWLDTYQPDGSMKCSPRKTWCTPRLRDQCSQFQLANFPVTGVTMVRGQSKGSFALAPWPAPATQTPEPQEIDL